MSVVSGDTYQAATDISQQTATTTVTYHIIAIDNESNSTTSSNYSYTVVAPTYCDASGGCDEFISRVQVGDIDNTSDCQNYQDFTSLSTGMEIGINYSITVTNGPPSYTEDMCGIWVDWNRNYSFYDAGETIAVTGNPGGGPYTATITPPSDAEPGNTRLRIRIQFDSTDTPDPCGTRQFGGVEDYTINVTPSLPPVADFSADNIVICQGESVTFTDNSTNNPTSWSWSITGPATFLSSNQNPSFTFITAGTYDVSLIASKSVGSDNETKTEYITVNAMPTANAGSDATICEDGIYTLSGAIGGGASSSTWSTSGTGTFNNVILLSATYTPSSADITAGSVTLTLATDNPSGPCDAVSGDMVLTINEATTADAGSDATICEGDAYALSGAIGGSASSGTWSSSGTGSFNNVSSLTATYTPSSADITAGSVTLTLTTDNPSGPCDAMSDDMLLTINEAATANAGSNAIISEGESWTLSGSISGGASSGSWNTSGTGGFNNENSLTATYTPSSADITAGSVILTITTDDPAGPCDPVSDNMVLTITPFQTYTLTTPATNGNVTREPDQATYIQGSTIELTAIQDEGYHFTGWTDDVTSSENPFTIASIISDMIVTANFAINEYSITVNAGSGGTITPEGPVIVNYGQDSPGLIITPDANFTIVDVKVNDISQGSITAYQFTNVTSDQMISATFDYITDISGNNNSVKLKTANFLAVPNPVKYSNNKIDIYFAANFETHAELRIYDPVGNVVYQKSEIAIRPSKKPQKVESWNLRNMNNKRVSGGTYLAVFIYTDSDGITRREMVRVGIKVD